jgi:hypothetical protein
MGKNSVLAKAIGKDYKGKTSVLLYAAAIPLSFLHVAFAAAIYVGIALLWLVPDKRIESQLSELKSN